jgi:predicted transcriptional regulator
MNFRDNQRLAEFNKMANNAAKQDYAVEIGMNKIKPETQIEKVAKLINQGFDTTKKIGNRMNISYKHVGAVIYDLSLAGCIEREKTIDNGRRGYVYSLKFDLQTTLKIARNFKHTKYFKDKNHNNIIKNDVNKVKEVTKTDKESLNALEGKEPEIQLDPKIMVTQHTEMKKIDVECYQIICPCCNKPILVLKRL